MDEIVNLFSQPSDNWTIDRIVMVGIGFPPNMYQLAMIVRLAEIFWGELSTNGKLEMYSQEHPGSAVRGPNYASGCELFLRKLGFECLTATTKGSDYARPAQDLVTKTTLLYTPFLSSQSLLQLMDFTDPEILINVAVDRYKMSQGYTVKEVEDIVRDFKATHKRNQTGVSHGGLQRKVETKQIGFNQASGARIRCTPSSFVRYALQLPQGDSRKGI
ncbi:hypothetical protein BLS_003178 [Venturia inaequalis]|uniref:Uncharacterized protein n=1 Tax=Venturia inaequalis TaxID=5025 RepID=A0A8H3VL04_VENIN|nr:hypothetical protein BLS_003178 [Venturia inaequalis]KAE9988863.1 hypothetical protein EG327_003189 [Venturia inaequalis]